MFSRENFAQKLQALRKERGEKQEALAEVLGVSSAQISEMERARKTTTVEKLAVICEYYNVSADYLLGLTEERRMVTMDGEDRSWSSDIQKTQ